MGDRVSVAGLAALRAELAGSSQGGGPGPMTAAVLASHQRAC